MSLWWRERAVAALAPDHLVLRRWSRGPRRRSLGRSEAVLTPGAAAGPAVWPEALAAQAAALQCRGGDLDVIVSSAFVRYQMVPQVKGLSEAEMLAYAQQTLESVYGPPALSWQVCLSAPRHGGARIAAAVDRELVQQLHQHARRLKLRLRSVQPSLAVAAAALPRTAQRFSGWLALVETQRLCVARFAHGRCMNVRAARYEHDAPGALLSLLEQDALGAGVDVAQSQLYLLSAQRIDESALRARSWQVTPVAVDL